MSNRDAKNQARQWVDAPKILAEDLRRLYVWVNENSFEPSDDAGTGRLIAASQSAESLVLLKPCDRALWEYRRMIPETKIIYEMWQPLMEALRTAEEGGSAVPFAGLPKVDEAIVTIEKWAHRQSFKTAETSNRSEILKVTIEHFDDEMLVKTDKDGSLKLRGSVNIPMFMAFWRAPKHRLTLEAFLDIDPGSTHTYLERHRARLCAQLQDALLEVVADGTGFRMQICRK